MSERPQQLRLYNTVNRYVERFEPRTPGQVTMYTCGPTVYRYVHIGNLRSYLMADWLRRTLQHDGMHVTQVKNITDVGHMRQELLERGEDKMIAAALAEGKTPEQIAAFYTKAWRDDEAALNILPPTINPKATDHVPQMVALTQRLIERGHAYVAGGNVYFDIGSFPNYGRLSGNKLTELLEGVRAEADPLKRQPADFTLWKAAEPGRMVKWDSPWGPGFPGWHIECSAMSMQYLGETIDLHTGGVDNIFPHHEDEIAQSEAATGQPFVRYWVHGQHLLADGLKMAKSTGNAYTLEDVRSRGFEPLAFRYLCLLTHYRARLNFTFGSLRAAGAAFRRLQDRVRSWHDAPVTEPNPERLSWDHRFWAAIHDDLNLPAAVGVLWSLVHSSALPPDQMRELLFQWDDVLGLDLAALLPYDTALLPDGARDLVQVRTLYRQGQAFDQADAVRTHLADYGYGLRDAPEGTLAIPLPPVQPVRYTAASDVPSLLDEPDTCDVSICLLTHNYLSDVQRCLESLFRNQGKHRAEYLVVDNGSDDGTRDWLEQLGAQRSDVRLFPTDHRIGEAEGRNLAMRQARGNVVLLIDTGVEATGDLLTPILSKLSKPVVGVTGKWGLRPADMRQFESSDERDVDAVTGYLLAFRRSDLKRVGWMDSKYRYYRSLDLHFCFSFRSLGLRVEAIPSLPAIMHIHRGWEEFGDDERNRRSKRNFYRFLNVWHHREDLIVKRS